MESEEQSVSTLRLLYVRKNMIMMIFFLQIVNSNGVKRLHKRVEQSVLKYSTLERKGIGVAKVIL